MDWITKVLAVVCMSMMVIGGLAETADAYTAKVNYFYEGIDFDLGDVYADPTILLVFQGAVTDIDDMLKPPDGIFPEFDPAVDAYFAFDAQLGTSLVLMAEFLGSVSGLTVGGVAIDLPDHPDERFAVSLADNESMKWITSLGEQFEVDFQVPPIWEEPVVITGGEIPEPATLALFGLGLLALMGFTHGKKHGHWFSSIPPEESF